MKVTKAILAVALVATAAFKGAEAKELCDVDCNDRSTIRQSMTKAQCHCYRGLKCLDWFAQGRKDAWAKTGKPQTEESFVTFNDIASCDASMAKVLESDVFPSSSLETIKINIAKKGFTAGVNTITARQAAEKKAAEDAAALAKKKADDLAAAEEAARKAEAARIEAVARAEAARLAEIARLKKEGEENGFLDAQKAARTKELESIGAKASITLPANRHLVVTLSHLDSHSTVIRANVGDVDFGYGFHSLAEYKEMNSLHRPPMNFLTAIVSNGEELKPFDVKYDDDNQLQGIFESHKKNRVGETIEVIKFPVDIKVKSYAVAHDIIELRAIAAAEAQAAALAAAKLEAEAEEYETEEFARSSVYDTDLSDIDLSNIDLSDRSADDVTMPTFHGEEDD